jgi:hypothetical protein
MFGTQEEQLHGMLHKMSKMLLASLTPNLLITDMLQLRRNRSWIKRCTSALLFFCQEDFADISIKCSALLHEKKAAEVVVEV